MWIHVVHLPQNFMFTHILQDYWGPSASEVVLKYTGKIDQYKKKTHNNIAHYSWNIVYIVWEIRREFGYSHRVASKLTDLGDLIDSHIV